MNEKKLKEIIEDQVFTTPQKNPILEGRADWLMDFRAVCLDPEFLDIYTEIFWERFHKSLPFQVGGMEVAAIPLVSAIVMKMREKGTPINGFFIRKSRKKSGLFKMIEGKLTNDPVILVDDLINNGYTLDRQLKVMEEAGKKVQSFFVLLQFRNHEAYKKYTDQGVNIESVFSLSDFSDTLGTKLQENTPIPKENYQVRWYFKERGTRLDAVIPKSGMVIDKTHIYFGTDGGKMLALDKKSGDLAWEYRIPYSPKDGREVFSTPVFSQNKIYFASLGGNIYCLDAKTGGKLWMSFEADWISGGLACSETRGVIYVPTRYGLRGKQGGVIALDTLLGKSVWSAYFPGSVNASPLVVEAEGKIFVGSDDGTMHALDINTGKEIWNFKTGAAIREAAVYSQEGRNIIFSSQDGNVYSLSCDDGLLVWKHENGLANYSSPFIWKGRVFFCSLDKNVYCLDTKDGRKIWNVAARARIFSSPRIYGERLYFGANDARMYVLNPDTGKQINFFQATERITNPVIVENEYVYLQTYAQEIFCLQEES